MKEVEVKKYLVRELKRAGLAEILIQRTPLVTRIVIYCDRPALVIGRKGANVKEITRLIEQDYRIEKPEIEVKKVDNPNLEPNIVAYRIASALERGMNSRKVGYKALQAVMRSGAKGAEIVMSGKLVGKSGRSRVLKMKAGYLKKCGRPSIEQVRHGQIIASCKPGVIGISVSIVPKNVHFPDEINVIKPEDFKIEEVEAKEELKAEGKEEPRAERKEEKKEEKKLGPKAEKAKVDPELEAKKPGKKDDEGVKAAEEKPAAREAPEKKAEPKKKEEKKPAAEKEKPEKAVKKAVKAEVKKAVKKATKPKAEKKAAKKPEKKPAGKK